MIILPRTYATVPLFYEQTDMVLSYFDRKVEVR